MQNQVVAEQVGRGTPPRPRRPRDVPLAEAVEPPDLFALDPQDEWDSCYCCGFYCPYVPLM